MTEHLCKLTDENMRTHGGFQWEIGKWVETSGKGPLCTSGWIHIYMHPLLAVALNPIHANFRNPRGFEIEVGGEHLVDHGIKAGVSRCRLVREIELLIIPTDALVRWAIQLALFQYDKPAFVRWAESWLKGSDRTGKAAEAAEAEAARAAAWAAARAAEGNELLPLAELLEQAIREESDSESR